MKGRKPNQRHSPETHILQFIALIWNMPEYKLCTLLIYLSVCLFFPWPTFILSPSISTAFSLKSTPIVASVFAGKEPPVKRNAKHVLPTFESPITMILKIRVCTLRSRDVLRSKELDARPAPSPRPCASFAIAAKWCSLTHARARTHSLTCSCTAALLMGLEERGCTQMHSCIQGRQVHSR